MIIFTRHALERIKQRTIDKELIRNILSTLDQEIPIIEDNFGNFIIQSKINDYLLRIVFRKSNSDVIVITADQTSKLNKYE
ncbi:MAG: DUF4258 domain-containing protein [Candidatus Kariarchaeaceae archaeon]